MTKTEQKKVLRKDLRLQRESVTQQDARHASEAVCAQLIRHLGVPRGKKLHVYAAKALWNEIDIAGYIEWVKEQDSSISIEIATHMPVKVIPTQQYDIVLVPVLGFDSRLYRLGMGLGWYDMFLAKQQNAQKIGIAYDWAEVNELVTEEHDVPMDMIVTPTRILQ